MKTGRYSGYRSRKNGGDRGLLFGREEPDPGVVLLTPADPAPGPHRELLVAVRAGHRVEERERRNVPVAGRIPPAVHLFLLVEPVQNLLPGNRQRAAFAEDRKHALELEARIVGMGFGALGLQELVGVVDQFSEGHLPGAVAGDLRKLPLAFLHAACLDRILGRGKGADWLAMQDTVGSRVADPVDPAPRNFFVHTPGQTEGGGSGRQGGLCFSSVPITSQCSRPERSTYRIE